MSIDLTEAATAVMRETMCPACPADDTRCPGCRRDAERWIRAALPHVEAQLREQIAREIEAEATGYAAPNGVNPQEDGEFVGLTRAAEVARGTNRQETDHA